MSSLKLATALALSSISLVHAVAVLPEAKRWVHHVGGAVYDSCTVPNAVALTFDDGPYIYETDISNILSDNGAKGTFFVNGNNYDCIYDERQVTNLRNVYKAGHMVASHTWSHADLTTLSWDGVYNEMSSVDTALSNILGVGTAFMRPPYGNYNDNVRSVAANLNQSLILWDFDSGDSVGASVGESKGAYSSTIGSHPENLLALNHETYSTTAYDVLPFAIKSLQAAGYDLVTVAECLGMKPYTWVSKQGKRDSSWSC